MNVPVLRFPEFRDAVEWKKKRFEDIAIFAKGKGISKSDISPNGKQPCIRYGELYTYYNETIESVISYTDMPADDLVLSEANDVIIPASGETQIDIATASCVLKSGIALGGDLNIIRSKMNGVFLSYYLNNAKKKDIAQLAQGISVVHLYSSQLKKLNLNIPELSEQQKIAACLSSLDELITAQAQKVEALKTHKKGLMQQLFPAEGETVPKLRFPEFRDAGEWILKTGDEITVKITKGSSPNWQGFSYQSQGVLFITSENVRDGYLDVSIPKYLPEEFYEKQQNSQLSFGDILINIVGASIGRSCLYLLKNKAFINQAVALFRVNKNTSFKFISYYYQNDEIQREMFGTQSESARPNLSLADLKNMEFYLPSFDEQQKIAACLSSVDELIAAQSQKVEALLTHKKGLMQQLFPAVDEVNA